MLNFREYCDIIAFIPKVSERRGNMKKGSTLTIICGHYGSGKTNLCLNLALESAKSGKNTVVMDMDIVNPYFRSSEYKQFLEDNGIKLIAPNSAGTTLDTPSLPPEIYSIFFMEDTDVFIDVGGDDAGSSALGRLASQIKEDEYQMIYVINCNRILSREPSEAVTLLKEIEFTSRLKATGIVNNSHMGVDSTLDIALASENFAKEVAKGTGLPLLFSTVTDFALGDREVPENFRTVSRLVLFPWEMN